MQKSYSRVWMESRNEQDGKGFTGNKHTLTVDVLSGNGKGAVSFDHKEPIFCGSGRREEREVSYHRKRRWEVYDDLRFVSGGSGSSGKSENHL